MSLALVLVVAGVGMGAMVVGGLVIAKSWHRVPADRALLVTMANRQRVVFEGGALVFPILGKAEWIELGLRLVRLRARGVRTAGDLRLDIDATAYLRIARTSDDVLQVARTIGCARASSQEALDELFVPKLTDALASIAAHLRDPRSEREEYRDRVLDLIGRDLGGFCIDDLVFERIERAGHTAHDPDGRTLPVENV